MKQALIVVLLVVCATCVPGLRNVREAQDQASSIAHSAASHLFWSLWTRVLDHELSRREPMLSISVNLVRQVVEKQMKPDRRPAMNRRQDGPYQNKERSSCDS